MLLQTIQSDPFTNILWKPTDQAAPFCQEPTRSCYFWSGRYPHFPKATPTLPRLPGGAWCSPAGSHQSADPRASTPASNYQSNQPRSCQRVANLASSQAGITEKLPQSPDLRPVEGVWEFSECSQFPLGKKNNFVTHVGTILHHRFNGRGIYAVKLARIGILLQIQLSKLGNHPLFHFFYFTFVLKITLVITFYILVLGISFEKTQHAFLSPWRRGKREGHGGTAKIRALVFLPLAPERRVTSQSAKDEPEKKQARWNQRSQNPINK